jgi:hypothetical protein
MKTPSQRAAWVCIAALVWATGTHAQLPQRDLTIEIRQMEDGRAEGQRFSAGPVDTSRTWEPHMLQVRNGEKVSVRVQDAIPMQWLQSAGVESRQPVGVSNALVWFDAGQSVSVRPQWPGGNHPAKLEIEVQKAAVADRVGADLPTQSRNTLTTTVTVPLAQWVTVAASGIASQDGTYSSNSGQQVRRVLQIRVMVP